MINKFKLTGVNYVPVLNGSILNCALRDDLFIDEKRPTFYTKDGIIKYNHFLINPFHHDKIFKNILDKNMIIDDGIIFADSGGLQEITLNEKRYTPEEVFKWQQSNSHIGFSVDSLPFITPKDGTNKPGSFGGWLFDSKGFENHAKISKENIEVTKKHRDKEKYSNFHFYGIIQGRNYNEYLRWYEILRDDAYLDGYCVKAPNINPITLAETCIFVMNNLTKPVHFLGIGNISRSIVIYYASKYIKQPITFDSSSYDIGTQYRSYLLPFMMNRKLRFVSEHNLGEDSEVVNVNDIVHLDDATKICDCVACRTIGNKLGDMIKNNDPILGGLISIHNLLLHQKWINYIKLIIDKPNKLKEFVKYNFEPSLSEKILNAFDMIDKAAERGPEYALSLYKEHMVTNKEAGKQQTIFG